MFKKQCNDECNKCKNLIKGKKQSGCLFGYVKIFYVTKK